MTTEQYKYRVNNGTENKMVQQDYNFSEGLEIHREWLKYELVLFESLKRKSTARTEFRCLGIFGTYRFSKDNLKIFL